MPLVSLLPLGTDVSYASASAVGMTARSDPCNLTRSPIKFRHRRAEVLNIRQQKLSQL